MIVVYSSRYRIDLGLHIYPTHKYGQVYERLRLRAQDYGLEFVEPTPASWEQLATVHTSEYLDKLRDGTMSLADLTQLELPWSEEMVEGFRLMCGGTIRAALLAAGLGSDGTADAPRQVVCHIGGGLHHGFPNHGEGFCPFNDVAVAARVLQSHGIDRVAVVDLDVHHGNGTAFIFNHGGAAPRVCPPGAAGDGSGVFTFSMHQQHNYPMWKPRSSLDIGLPDGTQDASYLQALARALPTVMASRPQCVFYLAGADPFEDDQLGGLRLTRNGLRERDRMVIEAVRAAEVPLVITLAGGYARAVEDTVAIHVATVEEAARSSMKTQGSDAR